MPDHRPDRQDRADRFSRGPSGDGSILLRANPMAVVPKGVGHKPCANAEVKLLLVEPRGVVNTGDDAANLLDDACKLIRAGLFNLGFRRLLLHNQLLIKRKIKDGSRYPPAINAT
ncbi:hypothetical protein [Cupriavidus sp. CP313]